MGRNYKLAGHIFEIQCLYDSFVSFAKEYEWNAKLNGNGLTERVEQIQIDSEDIAFEKKRMPPPWNEKKLELLAIHRKVCRVMADYHIIMFHSSALAMDGRAYLFAAPSGTGKSTHARLWREVYGDRVKMINDDKPLVRVEDTVVAFGSPWNGKHRLGTDMSAPVAGICILQRGAENRIERMKAIDAIPFLLGQTYYTEDAATARKVVALVFELAQKVPIWKMECNMEKEAAEMACRTMARSDEIS